MAWVPVDKQAEAEHDASYRVTFDIHSPYNVTNINRVIRLLKFGEGGAEYLFKAMQQTLTIKDIQAVSDIYYAAVPMTSDKAESWHLVVEFHKTSTGTPVLIVVGAILVLLALVIAVTGWTVEKFNEGPAGTTLSWGFLLAAAAALVFFWKKGATP